MDAACAPDVAAGNDYWYSKSPGRIAMAKAVCEGCPVLPPCLAYALDHDERFGVWGGLTVEERDALLAKAVGFVS